MKRGKPTINLKCPSAAYASSRQRIAEFSTANGVGGLMQITETADGRCDVQIYRTDPGVFVSHDAQQTPLEKAAPDMLAALKSLLKIVTDARADEGFDATTCDAGGVIFGDIASEAIEAAEAAIAKAESRADG